jgi:acyl-CoA thioesterase
MTQTAAEVWAGDRLALMANAAFGASRTSALEVSAPSPPKIGDPDGLLAMPYIPGAMPAFTQHIDYRWATPHFPFTGGDTSWVDGWCRPQAQVPVDASLVLMLIDAWPAPVLTMAHKPTSASSVTWSVNFIGDHLQTPMPAGSWMQVAHRSPVSKGGYADGTADVWAADGRLLARSRQLVTLFG